MKKQFTRQRTTYVVYYNGLAEIIMDRATQPESSFSDL